MSWKDAYTKGTELVLATASPDCKPNANIVISLGFVEEKLLIADSQMSTTLTNLKESKQACIVSKNKGEYYKIIGSVELFNSGKYFELCNQSDKQFPTKNAVVVTIKEVFDLDKVKRII